MYRTLTSRINPRFFYPVIVVSLVTAALLFAVQFYPAFASTVGAVAKLPAAPNQPAVGSGRIMYSANGTGMYVINADPNNQQPSYTVAGQFFQNSSDHPSVSSQTGRIAFAGSRGSEGVSERLIYAMDSDGLNVHPVTSPVGLPPGVSDTVPAISPDGSQIAFISKRFGSQPNYPPTPQNPGGTPKDSEVFVVNFDGTGLHQVTSSEETPVNNGTTVATVVAWSGNTLKVSARRGFTNDQGQRVTRTGVFTFNPDGTGESLFLQLGGLDFLDVLDAAGGIILYSFNNAIYVGSGNDLSSYTVITAVKAGGGVRFYQGVRFSPDGSRIVYSGDDDGGSIRTIGIDGSNPVLVRGNLGGTNGGIWWMPGPSIPTPARLRLDPAVVRVVNDGVTMSRVTPSLLDANGNVIFHAADFSTPCGPGYPCTLNPNNFTYFSDGRIRATNANNPPGYISFCGANGGLTGCSLVFVNTPFVEVRASVPTANTDGAGGPGVFTITRIDNASSPLGISFTLSGSAASDVDYALNTSASSVTMAAGQTSATINVNATGSSAGMGDKTVILTLQPDPTNTFQINSAASAATVTIKDNGPPAAVLSLSSITPNKGGDGGPVTATIYGGNIKPGATARLTRSGQADIVGSNTSVAPNGLSIRALFDLTGKAQGSWNVVVTNPDPASATLSAAFTIEANRAAQIWVDLIGRYTMRSSLTQTFYMGYGNSGNIDSPPSLIRVYVPNDLKVTSLPTLPDGSRPVVYIGDTEMRLEFVVPPIAANSAFSLPLQLTTAPELAHTNVTLRIAYLSSSLYQDAINLKPDPNVTLTPQLIESSDNHVKMQINVGTASGTLPIQTEVNVTRGSQSPPAPVFEVTDTGTELEYHLILVVPQRAEMSNTASGYSVGADKATPNIPAGTVDVIEARIKAAKDAYDKAKDAKDKFDVLLKQSQTTLTDKELIDCLRNTRNAQGDPLIDAQTAEKALNLTNGALVVHITDTALSYLDSNPAVKNIRPIISATTGVMRDGYKNNLINDLCGFGGSNNLNGLTGARHPSFQSPCAILTRDPHNAVAEEVLLARAAAICFTSSTSGGKNVQGLIVFSSDPNEKDGAQGAGTAQFISGFEPLRYSIFFENQATATAPAQTVVITDQLDVSKLDLSTFSLGAHGFGSTQMAIPPGLSAYTTDIDLRPAKDLIARVAAQLDKNSGLLTWRFQSLDPATGQPTTDPLAGFLPANKISPEGQGSFTFSVMPKPNLPTGTEIRNKARIVFDTNAPIDTNEYLNTIDNSLPASHVMPLAGVQSSIVFNVNWTGTDTGSGIQSYDVYASENGGPFTLWQTNATATSGIFIGKPGTGYSFYSVSRDGADNLEPAKTSGESFTVTPNISNSIDDARYYVWQHYRDFLGRQPDASGLDFWTNQITSCGPAQDCIDIKRINVSAAFYLSIEFQETGYLVERIYKASYGDAMGTSAFGGTHQLAVPIVRRNEFLPDTQQIGQGVVVGQTGWEQTIENNKIAFTTEFVQRSRFTTAFPTTLTPAQFVNMLFANAGVAPSSSDRAAAIGEFGAATNTTDTAARGRALRRVAENSILNQQEFNRAFVLMQYFGYLRRNPNDAPDTDHTGYDFWLTKLNQFNGNFVAAEMVKAFIVSGEYRQRFGP